MALKVLNSVTNIGRKKKDNQQLEKKSRIEIKKKKTTNFKAH